MRFLLDTNIIFSGVYNLDSNAGKLLLLAAEGRIELISLEYVKNELIRILDKRLRFKENEIEEIILSLPIEWIEEEIYSENVVEASKLISHERDIPILACALSLNSDIVSGDKHFHKIKTKKIKVWKLKKAVEEFE